jgi:tetratricopeptide (TPR) repeat protein
MADFETSKLEAAKLSESGEFDGALKLFREIEPLAPNSEERAAILIGEFHCLEALGQFGKARECLREATNLGDSTPEYSAHIAYLDARLDGGEGKNKSAIAKLDRLLEEHSELLRSPDCKELYELIQMRRLEYLVNVGRMVAALPLFIEATGFVMEKPDSFVLRMAYCLAKCGEFETAHNMMNKALASSNSIAQETHARYYLGSIYVAEKDYDKALVEFRFCEMHIEESDHSIPLSIPQVMDALAYVHEQMGHANEASQYRKAAGPLQELDAFRTPIPPQSLDKP